MSLKTKSSYTKLYNQVDKSGIFSTDFLEEVEKVDFFRQFFTSPDMSMRGTLIWITGLVSYVKIKDFTPCLVYVL